MFCRVAEAKRAAIPIGVAAACAIAAFFLIAYFSGTNKQPRPNVLLVVIDTLREDRVYGEQNGVPVMPNLRAFAEESLQFSNAAAQCTWTRPSVASIFTSLYFDVHKVFFSGDESHPEVPVQGILPKSVETLPEYLKNAGYTTWALQTNVNLHEDFGFARGFDEYHYGSHDPLASVVTDIALEKARKLHDPFFMYVHFMDPHKPYKAPKEVGQVFGPDPRLDDSDRVKVEESVPYTADQVHFFFGETDKREYGPMSETGREAVRRLYDIECRFMDEHLGRLLDEIQAQHPNTLIIVVSDHGEEFWEHGSLGHGTGMYAEQLDIPLLIHGPGIEPGVVDTLIEALDILPTISAYLGLEPNPIWQGRNILNPERLEERPAFSKTLGVWPGSLMGTETVIQGRFKLIHKIRKGKMELYDVLADPGDLIDLASDRPELVRELSALLQEHAEQNASLVELYEIEDLETTLDEETIDRLRQLGYL